MPLSNAKVSFWHTMAMVSRPPACFSMQIKALLTKFAPSKRSPNPQRINQVFKGLNCDEKSKFVLISNSTEK